MSTRHVIGIIVVAVVSATIGARFFGFTSVVSPAANPQIASPTQPRSPTAQSVTEGAMRVPVPPGARTIQPPAADIDETTANDTQYDFRELGDPGRPIMKRFTHEQVDPQWAPNAENKIRALIDAQPNISDFSSVDIECRDTLCRIAASIPLAIVEQQGPSFVQWDPMVSQMMAEASWKASFDGTTTVASIDKDLGSASFVTYLHRKPHTGGQARGLMAAGPA